MQLVNEIFFNPPQPHWSGRVVRQPKSWWDEFFQTIQNNWETDPFAYEEFMKDFDSCHWQKVDEIWDKVHLL